MLHEGEIKFNLARIQICYDPFGKYPGNIQVKQCIQCESPACMDVCPAEAIFVDRANGNVVMIDEEECIGCEECISACVYTPSRIVLNAKKQLAQKCDLCLVTPHWNEQGGPKGKQACVEVCPMQCIKLTKDHPAQIDAIGYDVNLRGESWALDQSM
jgi:protein NrfC